MGEPGVASFLSTTNISSSADLLPFNSNSADASRTRKSSSSVISAGSRTCSEPGAIVETSASNFGRNHGSGNSSNINNSTSGSGSCPPPPHHLGIPGGSGSGSKRSDSSSGKSGGAVVLDGLSPLRQGRRRPAAATTTTGFASASGSGSNNIELPQLAAHQRRREEEQRKSHMLRNQQKQKRHFPCQNPATHFDNVLQQQQRKQQQQQDQSQHQKQKSQQQSRSEKETATVAASDSISNNNRLSAFPHQNNWFFATNSNYVVVPTTSVPDKVRARSTAEMAATVSLGPSSHNGSTGGSRRSAATASDGASFRSDGRSGGSTPLLDKRSPLLDSKNNSSSSSNNNNNNNKSDLLSSPFDKRDPVAAEEEPVVHHVRGAGGVPSSVFDRHVVRHGVNAEDEDEKDADQPQQQQSSPPPPPPPPPSSFAIVDRGTITAHYAEEHCSRVGKGMLPADPGVYHRVRKDEEAKLRQLEREAAAAEARRNSKKSRHRYHKNRAAAAGNGENDDDDDEVSDSSPTSGDGDDKNNKDKSNSSTSSSVRSAAAKLAALKPGGTVVGPTGCYKKIECLGAGSQGGTHLVEWHRLDSADAAHLPPGMVSLMASTRTKLYRAAARRELHCRRLFVCKISFAFVSDAEMRDDAATNQYNVQQAIYRQEQQARKYGFLHAKAIAGVAEDGDRGGGGGHASSSSAGAKSSGGAGSGGAAAAAISGIKIVAGGGDADSSITSSFGAETDSTSSSVNNMSSTDSSAMGLDSRNIMGQQQKQQQQQRNSNDKTTTKESSKFLPVSQQQKEQQQHVPKSALRRPENLSEITTTGVSSPAQAVAAAEAAIAKEGFMSFDKKNSSSESSGEDQQQQQEDGSPTAQRSPLKPGARAQLLCSSTTTGQSTASFTTNSSGVSSIFSTPVTSPTGGGTTGTSSAFSERTPTDGGGGGSGSVAPMTFEEKMKQLRQDDADASADDSGGGGGGGVAVSVSASTAKVVQSPTTASKSSTIQRIPATGLGGVVSSVRTSTVTPNDNKLGTMVGSSSNSSNHSSSSGSASWQSRGSSGSTSSRSASSVRSDDDAFRGDAREGMRVHTELIRKRQRAHDPVDLECEAQVLSNVAHPCVVGFCDSFIFNRQRHLIIEFVDGHTLRHEITQRQLMKVRPFSSAGIARRMVQLLLGLEALHRHNIVHRDIKADNLLVSRRLLVKICDFGFAKTTAHSGGDGLNDFGRFSTQRLCTPDAGAPEIIANQRPFTEKVDLYSAGVVCYEMMQLELPFTARSIPDLRRMHDAARADNPLTMERVILPDAVDPRLMELALSLLAMEPAMRPSAAQALAAPVMQEALHAFLESFGELARQSPSPLDGDMLAILRDQAEMLRRHRGLSSLDSAAVHRRERRLDVERSLRRCGGGAAAAAVRRCGGKSLQERKQHQDVGNEFGLGSSVGGPDHNNTNNNTDTCTVPAVTGDKTRGGVVPGAVFVSPGAVLKKQQ